MQGYCKLMMFKAQFKKTTVIKEDANTAMEKIKKINTCFKKAAQFYSMEG